MRAFALLLALAACSDFPVFDATIDAAARAAPYPTLTPLDPVLAAADAPSAITPTSVAQTDSAIADLRARAAALRRPVLSGADRTRLNRTIDTSALR